MDVDLLMRDAEVAHREHGNAGKGFVHLEQIDIVDAPARLGEAFGDRPNRCSGEGCRFLRMGRRGDDPGDRFLPLGFCGRCARQDQCGRTI